MLSLQLQRQNMILQNLLNEINTNSKQKYQDATHVHRDNLSTQDMLTMHRQAYQNLRAMDSHGRLSKRKLHVPQMSLSAVSPLMATGLAGKRAYQQV